MSICMRHGALGTCYVCESDNLTKVLKVYAPSRPEKDPHGKDPHQPGAKLDAGKARIWLCIGGFARALTAVSEVTTKGALKYTPNGWKDVPDGSDRYMDAAFRHLMALGRGELIDADTGCTHKSQAAWNLLASLELDLREVQA